MIGSLATINKICSKKELESNYDRHLKKIKNMKSLINTQNNQKRNPFFSQYISNVQKIEKMDKINQSNKQLLNKIFNIMQRPNDHQMKDYTICDPRLKRSLNFEKRKKDLMHITSENQKLYNRISCIQIYLANKSVYNQQQWKKDFDQSIEYVYNISEYKNNLPRINDESRSQSIYSQNQLLQIIYKNTYKIGTSLYQLEIKTHQKFIFLIRQFIIQATNLASQTIYNLKLPEDVGKILYKGLHFLQIECLMNIQQLLKNISFNITDETLQLIINNKPFLFSKQPKKIQKLYEYSTTNFRTTKTVSLHNPNKNLQKFNKNFTTIQSKMNNNKLKDQSLDNIKNKTFQYQEKLRKNSNNDIQNQIETQPEKIQEYHSQKNDEQYDQEYCINFKLDDDKDFQLVENKDQVIVEENYEQEFEKFEDSSQCDDEKQQNVRNEQKQFIREFRFEKT